MVGSLPGSPIAYRDSDWVPDEEGWIQVADEQTLRYLTDADHRCAFADEAIARGAVMSLDRAAEQVVIGAILLQPRQFQEVREWLTPEDFEGTAERQVYQAICDLHGAHESVSPAAVEEAPAEERVRPCPS